MNLDGGRAVFQSVILLQGLEWQLPFLADRDEAKFKFIGDGRAKNEPTGINSGDKIEAGAAVTMRQGFDQCPKGIVVLQNRRDIAKLDSRLWPIGHGTNALANVLVKHVSLPR